MARKAKAPKDAPLAAVVKGGVLTITIGVDTLAFSTLASPFAWEMADRDGGEPCQIDPATLYRIDDPFGFATEVRAALLDEREDGSSLLTDLLDGAARRAIEDGAENFIVIADEIAEDRP